MNLPLVTIQGSPKEVTFSFGSEGVIASAPSPSPELVQRAIDGAAEHSGAGPLSPRVADAADNLLPGELENRLSRYWASVESDERTLCVACDDETLMRLPWEAMLRLRYADIRNLFVARVAAGAKHDSPPVAAEGKSPVLLAGWARLAGNSLPGIERELREVRKRLQEGRIDLQAMGGPTPTQLQRACADHKPQIVHLSSPGISNWWTSAELAMAGETRTKEGKSGDDTASGEIASDGGVAIEMVPATQVAAILKSSPNLALVVLNTCHSGQGLSRDVVSLCHAVCVGWAGYVQDNIAADFAAYFYERLLEGYSVIGAARSFAKLARYGSDGEALFAPSVWLPSPAWADWKPFPQRAHVPLSPSPSEEAPKPAEPITTPTHEPRATRRPGRKKHKYLTSSGPVEPFGLNGVLLPDLSGVLADTDAVTPTSAQRIEPPPSPVATSPLAPLSLSVVSPVIEIEFKLRDAINPALLLNGNRPIQHLSFESDREIKLVRMEIECDAGGSGSTYCRTMRLRAGFNPITDLDNIVFPALFDLASRDAPRRMINFTVRLSQGFGLSAEVLAEKTLSVQWMARNEWLDRGELWDYIPAFVQPNSRGVRRVLDDAVRMLRFISGPEHEFDGYQRQEPEHVRKQVCAIFQTLRDDPYSMTYINPLAGPVYEGGGRTPAGQFVRFPDEIIDHRRGTCHDLSLMFASCLEHVGIRPMIVLVRGHTFLGFWLRQEDHREYWTARARSETGRAEPTSRAVITVLARFRECVRGSRQDSPIEFLDCVAATDRTATYEKAVADAWKRVRALKADDFQAAVDVFAARAQVQPL